MYGVPEAPERPLEERVSERERLAVDQGDVVRAPPDDVPQPLAGNPACEGGLPAEMTIGREQPGALPVQQGAHIDLESVLPKRFEVLLEAKPL